MLGWSGQVALIPQSAAPHRYLIRLIKDQQGPQGEVVALASEGTRAAWIMSNDAAARAGARRKEEGPSAIGRPIFGHVGLLLLSYLI